MKTHRLSNVSLISPGILVENLHYGPYSRYWWQPLPESPESNEKKAYFPIRVNQKTKSTLNKREFIITIVIGNKDNNEYLPSYICQCDTIVETANDPTNAISKVYSKVFATETRYSGLSIMGWNDENIIKNLYEDVSFIPQSFLLEKIKIFIYGAGYSSNEDWFCAGPGYKSSLLYKFNGNKQALFVSKIEEDFSCTLEIYQDQILKRTIRDKNPIGVWKTSGLLKKFNGNQLFGIDNHEIQSLNIKQKIPTCSLQEWENYSIMESLFDFHLRRRTIANIDWYKLFVKWDKQESSLIELYNELQIIYGKKYEFNIRELRAWHAFLRATGAHNVTPWSNDDECQVFFD